MTITTYGDLRTNSLLSLSRYARQMGINPIRFFGGVSTLAQTGACDDTWYEYTWQDGEKVSRQEILTAILQAEQDIADIVGFWPAPRWIEDEEHRWPRYHDRHYRNTDGRAIWNDKSIKLKYGYFHYGGSRATTLIETATRGSDIDTTGDTYNDTAVWTITGIDFSADEIKAYIKPYDVADADNCRTDPESYGADPAWEVKDLRIQYDSSTETATVYIPRYQLFKPQMQRRIDVAPINADTDDNYIDDLVFYRVYNDASDQALFLWTEDEACSSGECAWSTQSGCLAAKDSRQSIVMAAPGTYDTDEDTYTSSSWTESMDPHKVLVSYYSGYADPYSRSIDKLSNWWASQITKLATARIERDFCSCDNIKRLVDRWQRDVAEATATRSYANAADLGNPLGTKVGELEVWRAINNRYGLKVMRGINPYI